MGKGKGGIPQLGKFGRLKKGEPLRKGGETGHKQLEALSEGGLVGIIGGGTPGRGGTEKQRESWT